MAKKLFEYAVLYHPKVTKDANGNETQGPDVLLVKSEFVLAADDKQVAIQAARSIPEEYLERLDQVEICVRPFLTAHDVDFAGTDMGEVERRTYYKALGVAANVSAAKMSNSYSAASVR